VLPALPAGEGGEGHVRRLGPGIDGARGAEHLAQRGQGPLRLRAQHVRAVGQVALQGPRRLGPHEGQRLVDARLRGAALARGRLVRGGEAAQADLRACRASRQSAAVPAPPKRRPRYAATPSASLPAAARSTPQASSSG